MGPPLWHLSSRSALWIQHFLPMSYPSITAFSSFGNRKNRHEHTQPTLRIFKNIEIYPCACVDAVQVSIPASTVRQTARLITTASNKEGLQQYLNHLHWTEARSKWRNLGKYIWQMRGELRKTKNPRIMWSYNAFTYLAKLDKGNRICFSLELMERVTLHDIITTMLLKESRPAWKCTLEEIPAPSRTQIFTPLKTAFADNPPYLHSVSASEGSWSAQN